MKRSAYTLTLACLICLLPGPTLATDCYVDSTGTNPAAYPDPQSAMAGACDNSNGPDSLIFECPAGQGPCEYQGFQILGRPLSLKFVPGDPSSFEGLGGPAIDIQFSQVEIDGAFKAAGFGSAGIQVFESELRLHGLPGSRATVIGVGDSALVMYGKATVDLERVELRDSRYGLRAVPYCSGNPILVGRELWIIGNERAGTQESLPSGCPLANPSQIYLELGVGQQPNYVEANSNGFETRGRAVLDLRHTIFLGNFRSGPGGSALLRARDQSTITASQILAYDNDAWADPGQDISAWQPTTPSAIVWATDSAEIEIRSSTLAHNQTRESVRTDGSGTVRLLSSISYQSGEYGVLALGSFETDGTSTVFGSDVNYDCACCNAGSSSCTPTPLLFEDDPVPNLGPIPGTSPWPTVRDDLYLMLNVQEVGPGTASPSLYPSLPWSVDGALPDFLGSPTDWGYHNPCPSC